MSLVEVLGSIIDAESGELPKARSTMRALLTLATLKPTEDRLTGSVVLALMNWMSKGDRATAPFSQELSKSECVRDITVRAPSGNTSAADSRSVLTNTGEYVILKILIRD